VLERQKAGACKRVTRATSSTGGRAKAIPISDPALGQSRKRRQKLALARLILGWQDVRNMKASENQFSLTCAAPSTSGRVKNQILIINNNRRFT
jgi:hypothetical protein